MLCILFTDETCVFCTYMQINGFKNFGTETPEKMGKFRKDLKSEKQKKSKCDPKKLNVNSKSVC